MKEKLEQNSKKVTVRNLKSTEDFDQIYELQNEIWQLSDADKISPLMLKAISMSYPKSGNLLGAFVGNQMVGFMVIMATFEKQTFFGTALGVLPEYENLKIGQMFLNKTVEFCIEHDLNTGIWTYEPLESRNAHLYLNVLGGEVVKYESDYYSVKDELNKGLPIDRFVVCSNEKTYYATQERPALSLKKALDLFPVITSITNENHDSFLVKIPSNIQMLKKSQPENALDLRLRTRAIFTEYVNNRTYKIKRFISEERNNNRENYYLIEK